MYKMYLYTSMHTRVLTKDMSILQCPCISKEALLHGPREGVCRSQRVVHRQNGHVNVLRPGPQVHLYDSVNSSNIAEV